MQNLDATSAPALGNLLIEELSREDFDRLQPEWDRVAQAGGADQPFFRHGFLKNYLDTFEPRAALRVFAARHGGRLVAALPLIEERAQVLGLSISRLRAPANVHSCRADAVCEAGRSDALRAIWSHLARRGGFDLLEIRDVAPEGHARLLLELAQVSENPSAVVETWRTPYIRLDGGWEAFERSLSGKLRANLRRRRRKLEAEGRVEIQRACDDHDLDRLLDEGFSLEASGWKGRQGTAIACDPAARAFYLGLAREAASQGELVLYFLRLDGRPVAFQFGLVRGDTYFVPKLAYDEGHADCSPGQLLMEEVLRDCCRRGLAEFDFLGPSMPWKLEWTDRVRVHHTLQIYGRTSRGRALHALTSRWIPNAKRWLRWESWKGYLPRANLGGERIHAPNPS